MENLVLCRAGNRKRTDTVVAQLRKTPLNLRSKSYGGNARLTKLFCARAN